MLSCIHSISIGIFFRPVIDWFTTFNFVLNFSRSPASLFTPAYVFIPASVFNRDTHEFLGFPGVFVLSLHLLLWCDATFHHGVERAPSYPIAVSLSHSIRILFFSTWVQYIFVRHSFCLINVFHLPPTPYLESFKRSFFRFIYNPCLAAI